MEETLLIQALGQEIDGNEIIDWNGVEVEEFRSAGLDGAQLVNYIVALAPQTIPIIAAIIIAKIRSQKHIKVIYKGTEIHGVSEEKIVEILETIYKHRKPKNE